MLVSFAAFIVTVGLGGFFVATPASAQLDAYSQVAPELAQPDKVKTSAADAADAAAAKAAALAALDRALPPCAKAASKKESSSKGSNNVSTSCALARPLAEDPADDPAWGQFEASYAGTVWLPPTPAAAEKTRVKAAGSYYQVSGREREREKKTPVAKTQWQFFFFFCFFFLLSHDFISSNSSPTPPTPTPPHTHTHTQIAKLPLSRSTCVPGSAVAARLVLRLPAANGTRFTAGLLPKVNELADSGTVRRCVLSGVPGLATPQEAAAAAGTAAASYAAGCTECNTLVATSSSSASSSGGYGGYGGSDSNTSGEQKNVKLCPSTPGVWYVDTLPLRVPTAAAGWCDDDDDGKAAEGSEKSEPAAKKKEPKERLPEHDAFAAFVVSAGSAVDVAFFDVVPRVAAGSGAQSA